MQRKSSFYCLKNMLHQKRSQQIILQTKLKHKIRPSAKKCKQILPLQKNTDLKKEPRMNKFNFHNTFRFAVVHYSFFTSMQPEHIYTQISLVDRSCMFLVKTTILEKSEKKELSIEKKELERRMTIMLKDARCRLSYWKSKTYVLFELSYDELSWTYYPKINRELSHQENFS